MKKTVNCLAILSSFVLGASFSYAGGTGPQDGAMHGGMYGKMHGKMHGDMHIKMHREMYKAMDSDGDGAISSSEFDAFHANKFREMDVNADGRITSDEMIMHRRKGKGATPGKTEEAPGKFDYYKTRKL